MISATMTATTVTAARISTRVIPASRRLMRSLYRFPPRAGAENGDQSKRREDQAMASRGGTEPHDDRVRPGGNGDGAEGQVRPEDRGLDPVDACLPPRVIGVGNDQDRIPLRRDGKLQAIRRPDDPADRAAARTGPGKRSGLEDHAGGRIKVLGGENAGGAV